MVYSSPNPAHSKTGPMNLGHGLGLIHLGNGSYILSALISEARGSGDVDTNYLTVKWWRYF